MRAVILVAAGALAGCSTLTGGQKLTIENRYASVAAIPAATTPAVDILAASTSVPPKDDSVAITALSDRGQAALITETKGSPPTSLKSPTPDVEPPRLVLNGTVQRRVVIALRPQGFLPPGDRIDALSVQIAVIEAAPWKISAWSQASNGQTLITIGTATNLIGGKLTAGASTVAAGLVPGLSVGGELDRSSSQVSDVKDTTDFDAAVNADGVAWLTETAGWRVNLAHNLTIDTTLSADPSALKAENINAVSKLTVSDPKQPGPGKPSEASAVHLYEITQLNPRVGDKPICATAQLTYRVRHIENVEDASTFTESDDHISLPVKTAQVSFKIAPPAYAPSFSVFLDGEPLSYQIAGQTPKGLRFATFAEAASFRDWLRSKTPAGGKVQNGSVGIMATTGQLRLRPLSAQEYSQLIPGDVNPEATVAAQTADLGKC